MMMIVLLILLPGYSSVAVAVDKLRPYPGMYILDRFAVFLCFGALSVLLGTSVYVIPSNNLSLLSQRLQCKCSLHGTVKYMPVV